MRLLPLAGVLTMLAACASDRLVSTSGDPSRRLSLTVGQELSLTLGTVGPGQYASPPTVSGAALRFLADSIVGTNPGGPTQRFWFKAMAPGQTVVTFHHTVQSSVVEDTVEVQY